MNLPNNTIFAIANHKGGVGKSTTTLNLGAGLANLGRKILVVDLDPQTNLTQSLGVKKVGSSIYNALKGDCDLPIVEIKKNLSLVPACSQLASAELELSMEPGRENLLKLLLHRVQSNYNYILIDCPPSLGLLTINALNCASQVIVPLQAHFLASQGLSKLLEVISKVRTRLNSQLVLGGIVITFFKKNTVLSRDIVEFTNNQFNEVVYKTKIRDSITIAESPAVGLDTFSYSPGSLGAMDYMNLCKEFLNRFDK